MNQSFDLRQRTPPPSSFQRDNGFQQTLLLQQPPISSAQQPLDSDESEIDAFLPSVVNRPPILPNIPPQASLSPLQAPLNSAQTSSSSLQAPSSSPLQQPGGPFVPIHFPSAPIHYQPSPLLSPPLSPLPEEGGSFSSSRNTASRGQYTPSPVPEREGRNSQQPPFSQLTIEDTVIETGDENLNLFDRLLSQTQVLNDLTNDSGLLCRVVQNMSLAKCEIFVRQCTRPHYKKDSHGKLLDPPNPKLLQLITPPSLTICQRAQENILHCAARNMRRRPQGQEARTRPDETVYALLHNLLLRELIAKTKGERNKYNKYKFFRCIVMQPNLFRRSTLGEAICASHKYHVGDRLVEEFIFERYASPREYKHQLKICWSNCTRLACGSDRRQSTFEVAAMVNAYDLFCKYFDLLERLRDFEIERKIHTRPHIFEACKQSAPLVPKTNKPQPCLEAYVETAPDCFEDCGQESKQIMYEFYNDSYPSQSKIRGFEDLKTPIFVTHDMAVFYSIRMALSNAIHMNHYEFVVNLRIGYERYVLNDVFVQQELAPLKRQTNNGQEEFVFPFSDKDAKQLWRKMLGIYSKTHKFYNQNPEHGDLLKMFVFVLTQDSTIRKVHEFYKNTYLNASTAASCISTNARTPFCKELDRQRLAHEEKNSSFAEILKDYKIFREKWTRESKQPVPWQCSQRQLEINAMLAQSIFADTRQKMIVHLMLLYIFKGNEGVLQNLNLVEYAHNRMRQNSVQPLTPDEEARKHELLYQIPTGLMFFGLFSDTVYVNLFFSLLNNKEEWVIRYKHYCNENLSMYQVLKAPSLNRSYSTGSTGENNLRKRSERARQENAQEISDQISRAQSGQPNPPFWVPWFVNVETPFASPLWYATIFGRVDLIVKAIENQLQRNTNQPLSKEEREFALCQLFFLDSTPSEISFVGYSGNAQTNFDAKENTLSLLYAAVESGQLTCFVYLLVYFCSLSSWKYAQPPSFPVISYTEQFPEILYFDPRSLLGYINREIIRSSQIESQLMLFLYLVSLAQFLYKAWKPYRGREGDVWNYQEEYQHFGQLSSTYSSLPVQILDKLVQLFVRAKNYGDAARTEQIFRAQQEILKIFFEAVYLNTLSVATFQQAYDKIGNL